VSTLEWVKEPLTRELARALRAATRRTRPHIDGHGLNYNDLKELWSAEDVHVVLTHDTDPVWQRWFYSPDTLTWELRGLHDTRHEAMEAALADTAPTTVIPGTYLNAWMDNCSRTISIKCGDNARAEEMGRIFSRMGYQVRVDERV